MINLQLPYSLVGRSIEAEFVAMAQTLGMGITAFSPIGGGLLSGKYRRTSDGLSGSGRLTTPNAAGREISPDDWKVIEALEEVATDLGRTMAQVAINWVVTQPAVGSVIIGASSAAAPTTRVLISDTATDPGRRGRRRACGGAPP
jgi:aryl-alcohol dehydrogenase-like predicted oxidoreductase